MGGGSLLHTNYKRSTFLLLSTIYPDYKWLPWKFSQLPSSYWDDVACQKQFLDWASKELNILEMNDWYKVTAKVYYICNLITLIILLPEFDKYWW